MKVRVAITLDIDSAAWQEEYGIQTDAEIRQDVKLHATLSLLAHYENLGLLAESA